MPSRLALIITLTVICNACAYKNNIENKNVAYLTQEKMSSMSVAIYRNALACNNPKALTSFFSLSSQPLPIPAGKLTTLRIINHDARSPGFLYLSFIPQQDAHYIVAKVPHHQYLSLYKIENYNSKKLQRTAVRFLVRKINFWGQCNDKELQENLKLLVK